MCLMDELIGHIHAAPVQCVLAVTGGGSGAISTLLETPGGSRTLLEAVVPYAPSALAAWLGKPPEQFCSAATARSMAMAAWQRARQLAADNLTADTATAAHKQLIGVGLTASLASDRPKRGSHRAHVAWQTLAATATASLELAKGARTRRQEEHLVARLAINALAEACGLDDRLPLDLLEGEAVVRRRTDAPPAWQALVLGETSIIAATDPQPTPHPAANPGGRRVVFPGAFNPLHDGHRHMAQAASRRLGGPVEFEISIENVDKPLLDYTAMADRAAQFTGPDAAALWLTRAATFAEKSRLFRGCTFVVGADTLRRIADQRYYDNDPQQRNAALAALARHGCRFLVFCRATGQVVETCSSMSLPETLRRLCDEVPLEQFREDVSSTELRRRAGDT
jgi:nicotinic acid mononucleotide adenylyltransferase/nicotinamide mononucleotide (NMN) deamidase PncC